MRAAEPTDAVIKDATKNDAYTLSRGLSLAGSIGATLLIVVCAVTKKNWPSLLGDGQFCALDAERWKQSDLWNNKYLWPSTCAEATRVIG